MNYIGSKNKLNPFIKDNVESIVGEDLSDKIFCDLFAGTGIVGRNFKTKVKKVISNDLEYYSYVLNKNYIENHKPIEAGKELIKELQEAPAFSGFIYKNYSKAGQGARQYFSDENARKIDGIRISIETWKDKGKIDKSSYYFLLASLLESADKVANTASVYGAYLKNLKKSAQKPLSLEGAYFEFNGNSHEVYNTDSNKLIKEIKGDILYLDPPYNARQYGANYHLLNTIAIYDEFIPKGKTGLRTYNKSEYCSRNYALQAFENLIENADFQYIFLSYNNEGLMSLEQIEKSMSKYGSYQLASTDYQRFKADKTENRIHKANKTTEYLHILEKK
ncbi:DNA adenine methylase [Salegentibacter sediminis]|uniref:DNA adenine methylase n=1 Tax=Salegentibacter sediminis TaxID=1930251 RepID=UPI0009BDFD01|nr:DNA adenine methylase [Salegentibacter sediminis]